MQSYSVLGVPPTSTELAIKAAYLRKAKVLHPDKGGSHDAFVALQRAYRELTDPHRVSNGGEPTPTAFADKIPRSQLFWDLEQEVFTYPCRCGDAIMIQVEDLNEKIQVYPCDTCSLTVEIEL